MYDEFERAITGRSSSGGMSVLGWLAAAFGFFFLVGLLAIGFAVHQAMTHVEGLTREVDGGRLAALARLADLEAQKELISMDPDRGLDFLRRLGGDDPAGAFVGEVVRGTFDLSALGRHAVRPPRPPRPPAVPDVPALPGAPDVPGVPDVPAAPEGPLVVATGEGSVRVSMDRAGGHRSLVIDADGERVRFDLTKGEDGAHLTIRTDDETVRLGLGDEAQGIPGWVPRFDGMPERPRPVYSLEASEGILGAVSWSGSAAPADILSWYRAGLEAQGYDLRDELRATGNGREEGAFWARNEAEGRMVFVVAHERRGETKVLLGYGEQR